jgi:hypothetical protein
MSAEGALYKLQSRYAGAGGPPQTPSPKRIIEFNQKAQVLAQASQENGADISEEVLAMLLDRNGQLDAEKYNKFRKGVAEIVGIYGKDALPYLDSKCIRKKGGINQKRLRRNIKNGQLG